PQSFQYCVQAGLRPLAFGVQAGSTSPIVSVAAGRAVPFAATRERANYAICSKDLGSDGSSVRGLLRTFERERHQPTTFAGHDPTGDCGGSIMKSSTAQHAATFREQNRAGRLLLPNAWDAASARIFGKAGFRAIGTTSAGIAYGEGYRDAEQIDRGAMVRAAAKIVRAVSVPVSADIE